MSISKEFIDKVKRWIILDNHIKAANKKLSTIRKEKNELESYLVNYGESNNLLENSLKFKTNTVTFSSTNTNPILNYVFIEECLEEILNDNESIKKIMDHIKRKREQNKRTNTVLKNKTINN